MIAFRHLLCLLVVSVAAMSGCTPLFCEIASHEEQCVAEDGSTGAETSTGEDAPDDVDPGDGNSGAGDPPKAPVLELSLSQVKQLDFEWVPTLGAQYYQLFESVDVGEPYVQVGEDMLGLATSLTVPLHFRLNASYELRACNEVGCTASKVVDVVEPLVEAIGYFKASNPSSGHEFGFSVALSGDGNTLAVGAPYENSGATGIDGDQANYNGWGSGAVYVFVRDGQNAWSQQAYVKASNTGESDYFGWSVSLSGDGNTLAVGALYESSGASGVGGNQADDSVAGAGAVYVFVREGQNAWSQQAYVKASNPGPEDCFGSSVALSGDGNTLAVVASREDSSATGIGGDQADNSLYDAGAVYVFVRDGQAVWSQQTYAKASNPGEQDEFGHSMALSGDGNTLAVGARYESGSALMSGAVYVFVRDGQNTWSQQAFVKASNPGMFDAFGWSVALSGDGNTLAVGALFEESAASGIDGDQADNSIDDAGAVYVFVRDGQNTWSQQAYVKASNPGEQDEFGSSVALSGDGSTLVVGAHQEASNAMGVGGDQADNAYIFAGAVYVFERDGQNTWSQQAYAKASNTGEYNDFGYSVALSGDANTLAVGAFGENSGATGIGGDQGDNDAYIFSGAVYLY
jgi:hypothetical protein